MDQPLSTQPFSSQPVTIRVASYNMRKAIGTDRRRRPDRVIEVLNEIGADVVALQEADRRFGKRESALPAPLLADHSRYRAVGFPLHNGGMGWHGNALLVSDAVEVLDSDVLHIPALEPRGAVVAELRIGGVELRVIGMHLDLSGLWRRRQAHAILARLADAPPMPTVAMGDLNEWTRDRGCLRDFGQSFAFAPCGRSFHASRPIAALDRIMYGPELDLVDCGVHGTPHARRASDHLPIWAELTPAGTPGGPKEG